LLNRRTQDLDFVDEVPKEVRDLGPKLHEIEKQHRLEVGHVQQHYFPSGWDKRLHSQPEFGRLRVFLVNAYDIFLSKLSSIREKDKQDLEVLAKLLNKDTLTTRFKETCRSFLAAPDLSERREKNWYVLFDEPLPTPNP
jgi:hypothetical protein